MPLPLAPGGPGLPQSPIQVVFALLLPAHLPERLGRCIPPVAGLARGCPHPFAREPLRALEFGLVDLIGGLLLRERVLLEVLVPGVVPLVEGLLGEFRVTGDDQGVGLQGLIEGGPKLTALGRGLLCLLLFGDLLIACRELLLKLLHLVLKVGSR